MPANDVDEWSDIARAPAERSPEGPGPGDAADLGFRMAAARERDKLAQAAPGATRWPRGQSVSELR